MSAPHPATPPTANRIPTSRPLTLGSAQRTLARLGDMSDVALVALATALPGVPSEAWARAAVATLLLGLRRYVWGALATLTRPARRSLLLCGGPAANLELQTMLQQRGEGRLRIAGTINLNRQPVEDVLAALQARIVDCVALQMGQTPIEKLNAVLHACESEGVEVWLLGDALAPLRTTPRSDELGERALIVYAESPPGWRRLLGRAIDLVTASLALAIVTPLLLLPAALAMQLDGRGPIFHGQERVGRRGRRFRLWKLRTMVQSAPRLQLDAPAANDRDLPAPSSTGDVRVTRVGRLLRRLKIDELPRLWNVLRGDLSLIGPRPPTPDEAARFEPWQRRQLLETPGQIVTNAAE